MMYNSFYLSFVVVVAWVSCWAEVSLALKALCGAGGWSLVTLQEIIVHSEDPGDFSFFFSQAALFILTKNLLFSSENVRLAVFE